MSNLKLKDISEQQVRTSAGSDHRKAPKPFGRVVSARAVPAFHVPKILARVEESLRRSGIFPPHAELTVREGSGDAILIHCLWLLLDHPAQPDRCSTPVKIIIHGDLVDQFYSAEPEMLEQLYEALVREVARRMMHYCADLGLPNHRPPPPFEIRVGLGRVGWVGPNTKLQIA